MTDTAQPDSDGTGGTAPGGGPERPGHLVVCRTANTARPADAVRELRRQAEDAARPLGLPCSADVPSGPRPGRTVVVGGGGLARVASGGPEGRVHWIMGVSAGGAAWTAFVADGIERLRLAGPLTVAASRLSALGRDGTAVLAAMACLQDRGVRFVVGGVPVPRSSTGWALALRCPGGAGARR
jgi:hypothetical protein